MTPPSPPSRDAYYREAESWNHDREAASRTSRRIAWIVAAVAALVAIAEACALVALAPLKTVVPYTLLVDRQTGYVQALDPLRPAQVGADTALTQSFVVQYIIARESFDIAALQNNYRKVAAWSEGSARSGYLAAVQASNPTSPLATLPRSTIVETRVKSVSPAGNNTLLVRFDTQRRDADGQPRPAQPWIAVIRYRYSGEPMTVADRFLNPLGFRVTHYQRNAEALVPDADPPVRPAAAIEPAVVAPVAGSGGRAETVAPAPRPVSPYPASRAATPSPLLSVRQPHYVTQFPPPPTAAPGAATPALPAPTGYNRRGQPIYGPTPR